MRFDFTANVGAYPFRRVPNSDVSGLLSLMDKAGLDMALVSALECVMYRNVQAGNELLAERIRWQERLLGAAVINPPYPRAAEDARLCLTEFGMKAIRLYPAYHGYRLGEEIEAEGLGGVMAVAAEFGAPVCIAFVVEDVRERHLITNPVPPEPDEVVRLIKAFPQVTFVLERAAGARVKAIHEAAPDTTNWLVETSGRGLRGAEEEFGRGLDRIVQWIGPERVLLGTDIPLKYARCALMKIESLELAPGSLELILYRNAERLLGIR